MSDKHIRCIFCGAEAYFRPASVAALTFETWQIECPKCHAYGPEAPTKEEAERLWTAPAAPDLAIRLARAEELLIEANRDEIERFLKEGGYGAE